MKAIVWTKYGPPEVLQLKEVEKPVPRDNEVLIRILATTVTAGDCELRSLKLPLYYSLPMRIWLGFRKPRGTRVPGTELAGEIEAVGKNVKRFREGDTVFGSSGLGFGAYAEYTCLPEEPAEGVLAIKPGKLTYEETATIPFGGMEALYYLRKGNIESGQKALIIGAGGSIGTFAVQLARYFGAEVTAVDSSEKLEMLRSIGAERVIDYKREDFSKSGETYDVIFDVAGKSPFSVCLRSLKQNGSYLLGNPGLNQMVQWRWKSPGNGRKVILGPVRRKTEDLIFLGELVEAGKIRTVIDRSYPLKQMVEAHRYVESGQKKGNVVITVGQ